MLVSCYCTNRLENGLLVVMLVFSSTLYLSWQQNYVVYQTRKQESIAQQLSEFSVISSCSYWSNCHWSRLKILNHTWFALTTCFHPVVYFFASSRICLRFHVWRRERDLNFVTVELNLDNKTTIDNSCPALVSKFPYLWWCYSCLILWICSLLTKQLLMLFVMISTTWKGVTM